MVNLVDIVTFEFENIPFEILEQISAITKVNPDPNINKLRQIDLRKKNNHQGIATTSYTFIKSKIDIENNQTICYLEF